MSKPIEQLSREVVEALSARGLMIVTAESCTGGLIGGALTAVPGSSAAVHGGFITYANAAKVAMLSVPEQMLADNGAVSEPVARAMAEGARRVSLADVAIAVTGIAGPDGGSAQKPVGLVFISCATPDGTTVVERRFGDLGRDGVRTATVADALKLVLDCVQAVA